MRDRQFEQYASEIKLINPVKLYADLLNQPSRSRRYKD
jgi:hypothetical protein